MRELDRSRLRQLMEREQRRFAEEHPKSRELFQKGREHLLGGVPMMWMLFWPGGFPMYASRASGGRVEDVDGHSYVDFCLGDTGTMTGHCPEPVVKAIQAQVARGISLLLPSEDAIWAGREMARRFGLPYWYFTLTATDANRFAIKICRQITERPKILIFNYCYHGTVDETFVTLGADGQPRTREGAVGLLGDLTETTKVVEFNDLSALEKALGPRDVACVLAEPAMTNIGIIHPDPGFHDALREITRRTGTYLIIDETHTISSGPGGYTKAHDLDPDVLTIGKPIASGVPAGAFGIREEIAAAVVRTPRDQGDYIDTGGVGGTLAGNVLSLAAIRATLEHILTDDAFKHMIELSERLTRGVQDVISSRGLPWHITRVGARAEYLFQPTRPRNGSEALAWKDEELDAFMHLYALNREIMLTPSHNMTLMCPETTPEDVDLHTRVFADASDELFG